MKVPKNEAKKMLKEEEEKWSEKENMSYLLVEKRKLNNKLKRNIYL